MKKRWVKIGGYGELGSTNWGFDHSQVETDKWLNDFEPWLGSWQISVRQGKVQPI